MITGDVIVDAHNAGHIAVRPEDADANTTCHHCAAQLLSGEAVKELHTGAVHGSVCCSNGKVQLEPVQVLLRDHSTNAGQDTLSTLPRHLNDITSLPQRVRDFQDTYNTSTTLSRHFHEIAIKIENKNEIEKETLYWWW